MSFNGMPSSSPMSPFGSSTRSEQRSMPGASINHMIGSPRNIPTFHEVPITICPDMISGDSPEIPAVSPTWSSSSDDFIPICNTSPSILLEEDKNPRSCAHTISRDGLPLPLRRAKRIKTYECDRCDMVFPRSSDLRTHQNVHAGEERFTCEFPNCKKKFGIISSTLLCRSLNYLRSAGQFAPA
ncbi:hypothetical protein B0H11DRAFT_1947669 [Mycena galericulata]|nr:hypothetical protein B0H11DRAFT_1947669 [Mycena galericulata]